MDAHTDTIRDLTAEHLQGMLDLRLATQRTHSTLVPGLFRAEVNEDVLWNTLRDYLPGWNPFRRRTRFAIGIERGGDLAGYLLYSVEDRPPENELHGACTVTISDIAVAARHRRAGLAERLIAEVRRRFADRPGRTEFWALVWTGNDASGALFDRAGFAPAHIGYLLAEGDD